VSFLRFDLLIFVGKPCFTLEIQDFQRFSWGLTRSHISRQKTAFHAGNSRSKRIETIVKKLGNFTHSQRARWQIGRCKIDDGTMDRIEVLGVFDVPP